MSEEKIKSSLGLYNFVMRTVEDESIKLLKLSEKFRIKYLEEKRKLPYHVNVIDELHINENGHSRILLKLLQFVNDRGEWEFLQSLVDYMKSKSKSKQFERINIKKPKITQEEARIDLWIRDSDYAIIFENKIYNAQDQEAQLSRYIEKTEEYHYDENNIFVVYLSQTGDEPDSQSWGCYQDSFKDRYLNLSFRNDILPWLKVKVLPSIRFKDSYLLNAIQQYTDYLDGLFDLRTIQTKMHMKLKTFITDYFNLEECRDDNERFAKVKENLSNIDALQGEVQSIYDELGMRLMRNAEKDIIEKYPFIQKDKEENDDNVRIIVPFDNKDVLVSIDWDGWKLYCQVEYLNGEQLLAADLLSEKTKDILCNSPNEHQRWFYVPRNDGHDDYAKVCEIFKNVVERLVK